jgi:flagellar hook-associated protein 2
MTTTASLSSPGIGSGLDVKSIVDKLVSIEHRPIDVVAQAASSLKTKISSFGLIRSYLGNLHDAAQNLSDPTLWRSNVATGSNDTVAMATTTGSTAAAGSYSVKVERLAQGQTTASPAFSDSRAVVGEGHLHIELGRWSDSGDAFTKKDSAAAGLDITLPADATLEDVRDRINQAQGGVTASVLHDVNGARLVLRSTDTGELNGFRVQASGPDADTPPSSALASLAYDPATPAAGGSDPDTPATTRTQAAVNARASINGVSVSTASNVLDTAVEGLRITLGKVSDTPVAIQVSADTAGMKKALNAFIGAYNDAAKYLAAQMKVDTTAKTAAPLEGDGTTLQLQRMLKSALRDTSTASSVFPHLLDVGLKTSADGTLTLDSSKADAALTKPGELAKAFTTRSSNTTTDDPRDGFGVRFEKLTNALLGIDGLVSRRNDALSAQATRLQKRQDDMEERLSTYQARLLKQYSALDTKMSSLSSQSTYLTQQINLLNKQSSSK